MPSQMMLSFSRGMYIGGNRMHFPSMKTLFGYCILMSVFSIGCKNMVNEHSFTMNEPHHPIDSLKRWVYNGDTNAYGELRTAYLDYAPEDFLFWSMLMANKHDYSPAYSDVFWSLKNAYGDSDFYSLKYMDDKTRNFALDYLRVAAKRNVFGAKEELDSFLVHISERP